MMAKPSGAIHSPCDLPQMVIQGAGLRGGYATLKSIVEGHGPVAIEIKVLASDDEGVLMNVAPGVFDNPIDPRMTNAFLSDFRHHLVVAVEDDKPRPELWINEVGVAPTHEGHGLGTFCVPCWKRVEEMAAAKPGCLPIAQTYRRGGSIP
jgi:hypothetical protein